jgi:hypothetical protein
MRTATPNTTEAAGLASLDPAQSGLIEALHALGPSDEYRAELALFGQFVGSWDIEWHGPGPDGQSLTAPGELDFGWILGGRAIQDVWRVPNVASKDPTSPPGFFGSTLRFYDPRIPAWRSTWIEPFNGRVIRFIGRPIGQDILLESADEEAPLRWALHDIGADSFRFTGEISHDRGATWQLEEEMRIRRRGKGGT